MAVAVVASICLTLSNALAEPGPIAGSSDEACSLAISSVAELNPSGLLEGALVCAAADRPADANYLLIIGQIRSYSDVSSFDPLMGEDPEYRAALELAILLFRHLFGSEEFYRSPANVDALEQRVRDTDLLLTADYDPGWIYRASIDAEEYSRIIGRSRESRIAAMRDFVRRQGVE
ncbi:MAG: hypothetical protein KIT43_03920 [Bauldia sp.]|nr:hypothetical protein [Bauldia sp.]MCW5717828.1 hypothetical protein [Bauldia sp.]